MKSNKSFPLLYKSSSSGTLVKEDHSTVILKSTDGKYEITMQVGKPVFSPRPKAVVEDLGTGRFYQVGVGDTIELAVKTTYSARRLKAKGKRKVKTYSYKVLSIDSDKNRITVQDRKMKKYVITTRELMPRVLKNERSSYNNNMPMDDPGMMPPDGMEPPPGFRQPRRRPSYRARTRRR